MATQNIFIKKIQQEGPTSLIIEWSDSKMSALDTIMLRKKCPCAVCIDEHTGEKRLDESTVPDTLRPQRVYSIGRYAVGLDFSDGHKTGIYTYSYLRELSGVR